MAGHMTIAYGAWEREEREGREWRGTWPSPMVHEGEVPRPRDPPHCASVPPTPTRGGIKIIPHLWAFNSWTFVAPRANAGQSR